MERDHIDASPMIRGGIFVLALLGIVPTSEAQPPPPETPPESTPTPDDAAVPESDAPVTDGEVDQAAPAEEGAPEGAAPPEGAPPVAAETVAEEEENEGEAGDESRADAFVQMSLEELLNLTIVSANRREESLVDAPAPMWVVTADDIRTRGYTDLAEILADVPGFDFTLINGTQYANFYQRGYRSPYTQRTLLMINGIVDNHLWWQTAEISRQYPISNIERVEILYGPASVVYGPNAFAGVINVITRDGRNLDDGEVSARVNSGFGTWRSRFVDTSLNARWGDLSISLSARLFRSDEPNLSNRWGWLSNAQYGDADTWGPIIDRTQLSDGTIVAGSVPGDGNVYLPGLQNAGVRFGTYHDPTDDHGIIATVGFRGLTLGLMNWVIREGYGPQYTADHAQNNVFWNRSSMNTYAQYQFEPVAGLTSTTLLSFRRSVVWGDWAEATPDWNPGMEPYSYVSYSHWNADNNSILFRQIFDYSLLDGRLVLSSGFTLERKDLTKNYDISGYWAAAFNSAQPSTDLGPEMLGPGVVHTSSLDPYDPAPPPPSHSPEINRIITTDMGGYVAATLVVGPVRFVGGLRVDHNSVYGASFNPRGAVIFRFLDDQAAIKLIFGTAFQEAPNVLLYGGWNGRATNPDLEPERAYNGDFVFVLRAGPILGDMSVFYAHYAHVLREEGVNEGSADAYGGELKLRALVPNPIPRSQDIQLWTNVSVAFSHSSVDWDFASAMLTRSRTTMGDIAPVKIQFGLTWPVLDWLSLTVRGNYVSDRTVYFRNALRDPSRSDGGNGNLDGYVTLDAYLRAQYRFVNFGFRVRNLFDTRYFHPGVERADSGDDFSAERSGGFHNSLIPQPGRSLMLTIGIDH